MSHELNGWAAWPQPGKGAMRTWREVKRRDAEQRNDPENNGGVYTWSCGHKHSAHAALRECGVVDKEKVTK